MSLAMHIIHCAFGTEVSFQEKPWAVLISSSVMVKKNCVSVCVCIHVCVPMYVGRVRRWLHQHLWIDNLPIHLEILPYNEYTNEIKIIDTIMENLFCVCIGYVFYFRLPSTKLMQKGQIIGKVENILPDSHAFKYLLCYLSAMQLRVSL